MAPRKFASVNYKNKPPSRMASFRDDSGLVSLRYEQTKQAEPPIPLPPPKNPRRIARPLSAVTTAAASTTTAATATTSTGSPVIVLPPPSAAPPRDQHPLFRARSTSHAQFDKWKRDSGLAPTASSVTIHVGFDEGHQSHQDHQDLQGYQGPQGPPADGGQAGVRPETPSVYPDDEQCFATRPIARPPIPAVPATTLAIPDPVSVFELDTNPPSPAEADSASRRIVKALGMRASSATKRLKKRTKSDDDRIASPSSTWGSLRGVPPLSPKSPASPKSPKSPTRAPPPVPATAPPRPPRPSSQQDLQQLPQRRAVEPSYCPITTPIPTDSLLDEDLGQLSFSKRGSILFAGKRPTIKLPQSLMEKINEQAPPPQQTDDDYRQQQQHHHHHPPATPSASLLPPAAPANGASSSSPSATTAAPVPGIRVLSVDVERESHKVRSLYDSAEGINWEDGGRVAAPAAPVDTGEEAPSGVGWNVVNLASDPSSLPAGNQDPFLSHTPTLATSRPGSSLSLRRDNPARKEFELAGGIEDWEDVDGADVDRYGFITIRRPATAAAAAPATTPTPATGSPESLKPSQFVPTKKRSFLSKRLGTSHSASAAAATAPAAQEPRHRLSARSLHTQTSELSTASRRSARSTIRQAANRLPHNRDRRWMDEAGEMLSLAPGLVDIAEDEQASKTSESLKRKEWERADKWRKMAKVVKKGKEEEGEGMDFEFDNKSQKLIDRTWKGIPDRWRSAAWYSFLASSARSRGGHAETDDEHLVAEFHRLQDISSPDDGQIDLDVPRTVNRHIMFRRRYRGGQRLLFRVLHAISLYFPDTGYVQGMASLAATLLCYYHEERCFVMLVWMWAYRGLEQLFQPGFDGLMAALKDLEELWLDGKDTARKLNELCIDATAYGTRWYLTLFNLSIPFAAQLRVWDIFMLLGDSPPSEPSSRGAGGTHTSDPAAAALDVLHATSAALIDALREILLDSDFENAMKALTSWIPIKDEELLMKVTRAEWKQHRGKNKGRKKDDKKKA